MNSSSPKAFKPITEEEIRKAITPFILIKAVETFRFRKSNSKAWQKNGRLIRVKGGLFIKEAHVLLIGEICLNIIGAPTEKWKVAKERILDLCGGKKLWRFIGADIDALGHVFHCRDTEPLLTKYEMTPGMVYDPKLAPPNINQPNAKKQNN